MDTIRCPRCQKLLRADAQKCSRCGITVSPGKASRKRAIGDADLSQPTSPLASPHRAGHYSGLHSEDQPFQSSFFVRVQRSPEPEPEPDETDASTMLDLKPDPSASPTYQQESSFVDEDEDQGGQARHEDQSGQARHEDQSGQARREDQSGHARHREQGIDNGGRRRQAPVSASGEPLRQAQLAPAFASIEYGEDEENTPDFSALADFPTLVPRRTSNVPSPETPLPETFLPHRSRRSIDGARVVRLMVSGSLICFLIATGLLAFLLVGKNQGQAQTAQPRLLAQPGEVRVGDVLQLAGSGFDANHVVALTRDTNLKLLDAQGQQVLPTTDARGAFQIHVPITTAWNIGVHALHASEGQIKTTTSLTIEAAVTGPPRLQLGISRIDLGSGNPATLSHKDMTLTNAGGGRVTWSAQSNVNWLSLSPANGSFAGNTIVVLTVNRANLAPQAYLGQIVFTQDHGSAQTLYVSMTVNTTSANLVLSTASLAFGGSPAQSPAGQTIVIQNNGGQDLNWNASTTTNGGPWLSITPASGLLPANTSAILTVNVATLNMALGTYQGALNFSYAGGAVQQVAITLNVNPPPQPAMQLSQQSLSFNTNQGFNPPPQSFTIANTGNAPLNWAIHPDANGQTYLALTPANGSVPPGQSIRVSVAPLLASTTGTIKSTLTIVDSDAGTTVPNQQVAVTIAITNQPVITLNSNKLEFDHTSSSTDTSTLLIFSNSGSLPLNWSMSASAQVPWLSFNTTSGSLAAGSSDYISVHCVSGQMQPGTYTVTLTLKDTDAGSVVAPQTVTVTLVISA